MIDEGRRWLAGVKSGDTCIMLNATVTGFRRLTGCRLALGLGVSGSYPDGLKVVRE
jgi:hypothetical protein